MLWPAYTCRNSFKGSLGGVKQSIRTLNLRILDLRSVEDLFASADHKTYRRVLRKPNRYINYAAERIFVPSHTISSTDRVWILTASFLPCLAGSFLKFSGHPRVFGCHRCISYIILRFLVTLVNPANVQKVDFCPRKDGTIFFLFCAFAPPLYHCAAASSAMFIFSGRFSLVKVARRPTVNSSVLYIFHRAFNQTITKNSKSMTWK